LYHEKPPHLRYRLDSSDCYRNFILPYRWFGNNEPARVEQKYIELYRYLYSGKKSGKTSEYIKDLANYFYSNYDAGNVRTLISKFNKIIKKVVNDESLDKIFTINGPEEFGARQYGVLADTDKIIFID
jgi:hypothetical protein